jgi:hypothetical protein
MAKVWFPAEARDFSLLSIIQTSSVTHPTSYPMGTGEWSGRVMKLFTHLHLAPKSKMVELTSIDPHALMRNFALSSVAMSKPSKTAAWNKQKLECLLPASCCSLAWVLSLNPKEAGGMFSEMSEAQNWKFKKMTKILDNLKPVYANFFYAEVI